MADRVTSAQLKQYMGRPDSDTDDYTFFCDLGNNLVEDVLIGKGLSDSRLFLIELNLDAHFASLAVEKGGLEGQKLGQAEERYQIDRPTRPNLSRTRYGQQAVAFDTSGTLSAMDAPLGEASFSVINPSDQYYPGPGPFYQ